MHDHYLLTFELHDEAITIHGSANGLKMLAHKLLDLVEQTDEGHFNHDHLMTDTWGGTELTSHPQSAESTLINHVKLYCWKGQSFQ